MDFFDYRKGGKGKGDQCDFYGKEQYTHIFCDICRGTYTPMGEYEKEIAAGMIQKGYVIREKDAYRAAVPVYTWDQYKTIIDRIQTYIASELTDIIQKIDRTCAEILGAHTPKHLQQQVEGIAAMDKFVHAVCVPASVLIERQVLDTAWHPLEMPTTYVVLN